MCMCVCVYNMDKTNDICKFVSIRLLLQMTNSVLLLRYCCYIYMYIFIDAVLLYLFTFSFRCTFIKEIYSVIINTFLFFQDVTV